MINMAQDIIENEQQNIFVEIQNHIKVCIQNDGRHVKDWNFEPISMVLQIKFYYTP